ncbi:MAG: hypothetical protein MI824_04630 [Hyphomicrobiales bacterium]|nr:hypothetical protein [Hyphomicrobiales bacterium]
MSHEPPERQGHSTLDQLVSRLPVPPRLLHRLGRGATRLAAQGLIALIAVGTPIAGLCLAAYLSPILVRAAIGDMNVIVAALLWLTLVTSGTALIYKNHVLPLTLRLCWRIKAWHRDLELRDAMDLPFRDDTAMVRRLESRVE